MTTNLVEEAGTAASLTSDAASKVSIHSPEGWVLQREFERDYHPERTGAVTVLLLDEQHHANLHRCYRRYVRRLETLQAVHHAAQWKLDFDPATQRVTIHSIALWRGDERFEHANAGRFRYLQREAGLEQLVLAGEVTIVALLEDVRTGDILDVSYTIETRPRILSHRYSAITHLPEELSVRAFHFSVRFPTGDTMQSRSLPESFTPAVREIESETEWTWTAERLEGREPEPAVPGWHPVGRQIQISDCESWEEVASSVRASWRECFDAEGLERTAATIASSTATGNARVEMALRMTQDEIRYLSNNIELGGQIPTSPEIVLRQRFGDCKDKSFLLAHLLRRLGVSARPVLVNTTLGRGIERMLPTPLAFNHVVVEYELEGKRRTVDPTMPLQGGGPLGRGAPNFGLGLPIGPGVTKLERLPVLAEPQDSYELHETFSLDSSRGPSRLRMQITARGLDADGLRASLALEGQEAVSQKREQFYRQLFPDVRRAGTLKWNDDREKNEIILTESFDLPNLLLPTPERDGYVFQCKSHLIQAVLAFPDLRYREHPFALRNPCRAEHRIDIESGTLSRREPETFVKKDSAFRFMCESQGRTGRWTYLYRLQTFTDAVPALDFQIFKQKVLELWPCTYLQFLIPPGISAPRRYTSSASLPPTDRVKGEAKIATGESFGQEAEKSEFPPLPAEAAPALLSAATEEGASPEAPPRRRVAPPERDVSRPRDNGTRFAPVDPVQRQRRRRKRSAKWKIWAAATIILGVLVTIWYLTQPSG